MKIPANLNSSEDKFNWLAKQRPLALVLWILLSIRGTARRTDYNRSRKEYRTDMKYLLALGIVLTTGANNGAKEGATLGATPDTYYSLDVSIFNVMSKTDRGQDRGQGRGQVWGQPDVFSSGGHDNSATVSGGDIGGELNSKLLPVTKVTSNSNLLPTKKKSKICVNTHIGKEKRSPKLQKAHLSSKNSRIPCTREEIIEIAGKNNVRIRDVHWIHEDICDHINNGTFDKKYKTVYYTLSNWVRIAKSKGRIMVRNTTECMTFKIDSANYINNNFYLG